MRNGLRSLMEMEGCGRVVAEADSPAGLARDVPCDCVIFFCLRRSPQAVEFARELAPVPLLVMTGEEDPESLGRDLEAGVRGFVPVTVGMHDLREAVLRVCRGEQFLDPALAATRSREPSLLSSREQEILKLLKQGLKVEEIAQALNAAPSTVKTHIRNLLQKSGWDRRDGGYGGSLVPRVPRSPVRGPGRGAEWPD